MANMYIRRPLVEKLETAKDIEAPSVDDDSGTSQAQSQLKSAMQMPKAKGKTASIGLLMMRKRAANKSSS